MPTLPTLTLVDPRAGRRAARRQRLAAVLVGTALTACSAVPFALTLWP